MEEFLLLIGIVTFGFALVSNRIERLLITPPMIFTAIGVLVSVYFSEKLSEFDAKAVLEIVAELTLVIVLFTDCLLYTSPSPRDGLLSRMPSSA